MNRLLIFFCFTFLITIYSCGNDDDTSSSRDSFFENALTSANNEQIEGRWSIYQIEFEGELTDIPESFIECGRDFFDFQPEGEYREYLFDDNFECTPEINMLSWTLANGIVTLSNGVETDQIVITELTSNLLVFKFRLDTDADGEIEIFKAICNRYEPPMEMDIYSGTFFWDSTVTNNDKILLKWDGYRGYNEFEKYEIYRLDESCDTTNPQLISTITDINQNFLIDLSPEPFDNICYIFKIYTNEGLLGESSSITVFTGDIEVPPTILSEPILTGTTVQLNWEQYEGYYFSHYEVVVRNYSSGSGAGYQEDQLTVINNIETTSYSAELPYMSNPVFVIHTYNIFGIRSQTVIEGQNQQSTNFVREDLLPINTIRFLAFSPNETILYYSDFSTLYRYNYNSNAVESSTELNSSSIVFVKVFESAFGTEVIVNTGGSLKVYDDALNFKYNLQESSIFGFSPEHLAISEAGYWLITDREKLYSFARADSNLNLISSNDLYNQLFSSSRINVMDIGQNRILAGNYTQSQGLIVEINSNGELSNNADSVNLNATSQWKNNSLFSDDEQYVLNVEDNTLYSTGTNNLISTLNQSYFPSGISNDGLLILGTNNNPDFSDNSFHEKNVRTLSYPNLNEQIYNSKGYPHVIFQNHLGQIVSISKGLVGSLDGSSPENDIFIEIIE